MPNIFDQFDEPTTATVDRAPSPGASTLHPRSPVRRSLGEGGSILADTAKVAVRRPNGEVTTIPAIHLKAALQYGYKPITQ